MAISDFSEMLTSTVTVYPLISRDSYSKPTYGTGVAYSARISERHVKVRDPNGEEVVADGKILIDGNPTIPADSKIILPDLSEPVIMAVNRAYDENGPHHTRIFFAKRGG